MLGEIAIEMNCARSTLGYGEVSKKICSLGLPVASQRYRRDPAEIFGSEFNTSTVRLLRKTKESFGR
jgi:hypothetical protein